MAFLFSYLKDYKKLFLGALALATVNQVFSLLDPQIFRMLIDNYASRATDLPPGVFVRGVATLLLAAVGVAFVSRVAKNFQDYYVNVITQRAGTNLYARSVAHSFSLPYAVFEDQRSGELLQKLQKARTDAQTIITSFVNIVFFSLVGVLFVVVYAFTVHWTIGALFLLIIPTLGTFIFYLTRRIKAAQQMIVRETAELAGSTTETLRNVELVKSLGLESQEVNRLNEVNDRILALELKKVRLIRTMSFAQGTMVNGVRSLLLFLMLWLIAQGIMTLGEFFSLLFYSFLIFNPLGEMGIVAAQYQEARASSEELHKILAIKSEPKPASPVAVAAIDAIAFKKVNFSYASSDAASLREISLAIHKGETVAFVGPSGSGKSTLVKLLLGLYKPEKGTLMVNGVDAHKIDYDAFKRLVGYVSQETQLFAGTVRENLLFVNPAATDEECLSALRSAAALPIIERPSTGSGQAGGKGLDTKIGEGGIKISGGERQRLAIARALLRNPELIIFDEATSSLDSITEKAITAIIQTIAKERPNLITILIAHRLSTVAHADRIYVLERGKIVESGAHGELLKKKGLYAALWREQSAAGSGGLGSRSRA